ncbi:MAG TPA: chromosomal replication initiator protein DnaA [Candidatus Woesebacteria bacterium]|jgi:chromosomal replication initiator protein|nr:chromosomal replication initiator protein DnaA [Candidatus Shapirobacteria bacterium]HOR01986.1 chromosomal replication initiator protein DnaA [Candidatus Woesebacteria bacterium]
MDINRLWKNTQEELKIVLAPAVFQTFVSKTELISLQNNKAVLACPNSYLVDINKKRYYQIFKDALDNQTKTQNTLEFIVQEPLINPSPINSPLFEYTPKNTSFQHNLHPKFTFDTLIVGNSNNFAYAAAQGIIKNPGLSYNPLFIWGGVGVGKTHLMQAVGHELLKNNPQFKIKYFPAETFSNELVASLKSKTMNQFKDKYRNLDCILVDDVQFLAGKEYTQEEFFHTFNALHMKGKQIILTSDRKPSEIDHLEDRLVSRFMGGLTVDIQLPDYEMRVAVIKQKTEEFQIQITPEAISFLATNIESNIREIEGKLKQILIQSSAQKIIPIDLSFVQNFLNPDKNSSLNPFSSSKINPRHLISVCAKTFNIKTSDLCGRSRKKDLVYARHLTAYILLTEANLSLEEVGRLLGGRDHTSIMHARDKIHQDLSTNPQTTKLINQIKSSF